MSGLRDQLRLLPDVVLPTFEQHARFVGRRVLSIAAVVVGISCALLVPTDYLFLDAYPGVADRFLGWRLFSGAVCAACATWLWLRRGLDDDPFWIALLCGASQIGVVGWSFALAGGVDAPWFQAGSILVYVHAPIPVSFSRRLVLIGAFSSAFLVGAHLGRPDLSSEPFFLYFLGFFLFNAMNGLIFGVTLTELLRRNWEQGRRLAQQTEELKRLDQQKADLTANVTHELKTPLTLILASLRRMKEVAPEDADVGLRSAARLLVLVQELLTLARFDARHAEPEWARIDVAALVREVAEHFRPGPGEGVLEVVGTDTELLATVDARQLRTLVFNLLSNAMKFTEPSGRRVSLRLEQAGEGYRITVEDNGIGIRPDVLPRVFERFYQAESGQTRRHGGTGIGLALVKAIAEAHGGTVRAESEPGAWTRLEVTLPRRPTGAPEDLPRTALAPDETLGLAARAEVRVAAAEDRVIRAIDARVVVVEDDADLRGYLTDLLTREGHAVVACARADEALERASAATELVVSDVMMPGMDGLELTRRLRARPETANVPVILLTARGEVESRLASFAAGADDHLGKPFDERELVARVRAVLEARAPLRALARTKTELEGEVQARSAELRELAAHLTREREEERARLSRELHDELGQILTAMRMEVELARTDAERAASLERLDRLLDEAMSGVRALVQGLRPRVLDELPLPAAIEWLVDRFATRTGVRVSADLDARVELHGDAAVAAFRFVQEALTNVERHAGARHVSVRLRRGEGPVLEVADDGRGMDVQTPSSGFGLRGLKERVLALGGALSVEARPGEGTTLRMALPASSGTSKKSDPRPRTIA